VAVAIGAVVVFQKLGVRTPLAYVAPAVAVWAGVYGAGLHPTLAGVLVGLMTPVRPWFTPKHLLVHADASAAALRQQDAEDPAVPHLQELGHAVREAVSPVERLEHALHGWVAFGVMPLFALANAGVTIGGASLTGDGVFLFFGVMLGFALGKPIGVLGLSWLCVRLGVAALPAGVSWANVALVGLVSGIGFTMAIFIAQLAFPSGMLLETAKLAVLSASVSLAVLAYVLGRILLPPAP
jgi:NhaA family Na+:H+ antiporter